MDGFELKDEDGGHLGLQWIVDLLRFLHFLQLMHHRMPCGL